jgi:hydroxypyruvate isomerase
MLRVDLNISILLKEYPFLERFARAKELGFDAIEFYWNKDHDPNAIAARVLDNGLSVAAFNLDAGDLASGERGLLNDPGRSDHMRRNVSIAMDLAVKVGCNKLTALAGNLNSDEERSVQIDRIRENLAWICREVKAEGITVMVEAVNAFDNKSYPFTNTPDTIEFLESVEAANCKYLYDIYHMQRMEGNIIATIEERIDRIAHVQIADSPRRRHPGTGELNYRNIFEALERSGYEGSVGLEYIADGSTADSLGWLSVEYRREIDIGSLEI